MGEEVGEYKDLTQENGKYNVICQSCGKILGINVENQEKALKIEEKHSEKTDCQYTASHLIRKN